MIHEEALYQVYVPLSLPLRTDLRPDALSAVDSHSTLFICSTVPQELALQNKRAAELQALPFYLFILRVLRSF